MKKPNIKCQEDSTSWDIFRDVITYIVLASLIVVPLILAIKMGGIE